MKIISIVGTRPQFLKVIALDKLLSSDINHVIVNSGQHFDHNLSNIHFASIGCALPKYNLNINCKTHGQTVGQMIIEIEKILMDEKPEKVLVYGDCDTTLAGALATKKLNIHLIHIEAGLRSFNKSMPEEINRIVVDHISDTLLCPNEHAKKNLNSESIYDNIHIVDNLQISLLKHCLVNKQSNEIYVLLTMHRSYNTNESMIRHLFAQLQKNNTLVIFPCHPKISKIINEQNIEMPNNIRIIDPVDYPIMCQLLNNCQCVVTDSGGIQVEAMYLNKKCFTIRTETEWIDTLDYNNCLVTNIDELCNKMQSFLVKKKYDICQDSTNWNQILLAKN